MPSSIALLQLWPAHRVRSHPGPLTRPRSPAALAVSDERGMREAVAVRTAAGTAGGWGSAVRTAAMIHGFVNS